VSIPPNRTRPRLAAWWTAAYRPTLKPSVTWGTGIRRACPPLISPALCHARFPLASIVAYAFDESTYEFLPVYPIVLWRKFIFDRGGGP
jgi:hypothetical protein